MEPVEKSKRRKLRKSNSLFETGADQNAYTATIIVKLLYPDEFEQMKGDADVLIIERVKLSANAPISVKYSTYNKTDV